MAKEQTKKNVKGNKKGLCKYIILEGKFKWCLCHFLLSFHLRPFVGDLKLCEKILPPMPLSWCTMIKGQKEIWLFIERM